MDTQQCEHCGTVNEAGRALCSNCQSPLRADSGQLRGETYKGKLAAQVDQLGARPLTVKLMAAFLVLIAIGWPLRGIYSSFAGRVSMNSDSTNYVASAFGAITPILTTIVCLPLAGVLIWIAWSAMTQQVRGWKACLVAMAAFAAYTLCRAGEYRGWTILWLGLAVTLTAVWFHRSTKAWFGLS
jgi:hypothetical protein